MRRFPPQRTPRAASALPVRMGSCVVSLVFISSSSGLFERGEGLAPFHDRGRSGVVCPTLAAAEPDEREKGNGRPRESPGTSRKDRPIDPTSGIGYARFTKPDPASSLSQSGRAPALYALEYLAIPAFQIYPFRFAHARRMQPLSVGDGQAPFIQRLLLI